MPDGDKVHKHLSGPYQPLYKQVCEGRDTPEELALASARPLCASRNYYGDGPVQLIEEVMTPLTTLSSEPILRELAFRQARQSIDSLQRRMTDNKRGGELAANACQKAIIEMAHGDYVQDPIQQAKYHYIMGIYDANFEQRVPTTPHHYMDADPADLNCRLRAMRPNVEQTAMQLASQVQLGRRLSKRRLLRPKRERPVIELHDKWV